MAESSSDLFIGIILGGVPYIIELQYIGQLYHPSGPWYDVPDLVVNLSTTLIMRSRGKYVSRPVGMATLSVLEVRKFKRAENITHLRDNKKGLQQLRDKNEKLQNKDNQTT
jgi:hypothetical protein